MKVTLISPYENISAYGLRVLSAVLKRAGFPTQLIFLPRETEGLPWDGFRYPYAEAVLDQLAAAAGDSDLIGISLSTSHFFNAVQITARLRRCTRAPIVWGGIHPTVRPEECLEHADLVCMGEGEDALLDLVQRLDCGEGFGGINNIWYRENGELVRTPLYPLRSDLDSLPYPDYDLDNSFVLARGRIQPMTTELQLHFSRCPYSAASVPAYEATMSRGCSYSCAYCCNNALRAVYPHQWKVRRLSVARFIAELQHVLTRLPFQLININDDEFIDDVETLSSFCQAYRQSIAVPFVVVGFEPAMVDEEKVQMLIEAGMKVAYVGVQSGSRRTLRLYHRPERREHVLQAAQAFKRFAGRIDPPYYDVIVDNPWETEQDQLDTLSLLLELPRPYRLQLFSLTLYPGTELFERARQEGRWEEIAAAYQKHYLMEHSPTYVNGLLEMLTWQHTPRWLVVWLMSERMRRRDWIWLLTVLNGVFRFLLLMKRGWQAVWRRDWGRISWNLRVLLGRRLRRYQGSA